MLHFNYLPPKMLFHSSSVNYATNFMKACNVDQESARIYTILECESCCNLSKSKHVQIPTFPQMNHQHIFASREQQLFSQYIERFIWHAEMALTKESFLKTTNLGDPVNWPRGDNLNVIPTLLETLQVFSFC